MTPYRTTIVIAGAMIALGLWGCGPRAPQVNFANRVYSGALRTATNTKSLKRLTKAKQLIDRDHASGAIDPEEYGFYRDIIELGEAGRWHEAEQLAIRFRRDQFR